MINLRVDQVLFDYLQRTAKANARTLAAEASFRLTKSMIEESLRIRLATKSSAPQSEENAA